METRTLILRSAASVIALLALATATSACGDDDKPAGGASTVTDGKDAAAVRADLMEEIAAEASGNVDNFLKHVTDNWLANVTHASREDVKKDPSLFKSEDTPKLGAIKVAGEKATVAVSFDQQTFDYNNSVDVVKQGGVWKLNDIHVVSATSLPSGAKKVNIDLNEYAFGFVRKDVTSTENLVLHMENKGKQHHMMAVVKIPKDADLDKLLASPGPPEGAEDIGGVFLFSPGDKGDVVVRGKLAPGRYAFLCFVVDPDDPKHEPHTAKGMKADVTVQ